MPICSPILYASGFSWPEAPRWHDNALWISDVHNFRIARVGAGGVVSTEFKILQRPAGMDFQNDGRLLLGTSLQPLMLSGDVGSGDLNIAVDLTGVLNGNLNDMITAADGWSWIGDTGFTFGVDTPVCRGKIIAYHADHGARVVTEEVFFPNGMVVSPNGETLYVSETFGKKITAFDILKDGALSGRRVYAELPGHPDGLCAGVDGQLWIPLLMEERFVCLSAKAEVIHEIAFPGRKAIACIMGGQSGSELFLCTAEVSETPDGVKREGTVHVVKV